MPKFKVHIKYEAFHVFFVEAASAKEAYHQIADDKFYDKDGPLATPPRGELLETEVYEAPLDGDGFGLLVYQDRDAENEED